MEYITDPVFIWSAVLVLLIAIILLLRYISKKTGINTDDLQDIANDAKEVAEKNLEQAVISKITINKKSEIDKGGGDS
jgi:hypothetical protein